MKNFDGWMQDHFGFDLSNTQAQSIDDFAGAVGFTIQEHVGAISFAIMGTILGLFLLSRIV